MVLREGGHDCNGPVAGACPFVIVPAGYCTASDVFQRTSRYRSEAERAEQRELDESR